MVTSQWLLKRVGESEQRIYLYIKFGPAQFKMLAYAATLRAQLERSFRTPVADMKQSQKERQESAAAAATRQSSGAHPAALVATQLRDGGDRRTPPGILRPRRYPLAFYPTNL